MGGVVWRWAGEFLQPESALAGPSSSCLLNQPICSKDSVDYFDDELHQSELNIILGLYEVFGKYYDGLSYSPLIKYFSSRRPDNHHVNLSLALRTV